MHTLLSITDGHVDERERLGAAFEGAAVQRPLGAAAPEAQALFDDALPGVVEPCERVLSGAPLGGDPAGGQGVVKAADAEDTPDRSPTAQTGKAQRRGKP